MTTHEHAVLDQTVNEIDAMLAERFNADDESYTVASARLHEVIDDVSAFSGAKDQDDFVDLLADHLRVICRETIRERLNDLECYLLVIDKTLEIDYDNDPAGYARARAQLDAIVRDVLSRGYRTEHAVRLILERVDAWLESGKADPLFAEGIALDRPLPSVC